MQTITTADNIINTIYTAAHIINDTAGFPMFALALDTITETPDTLVIEVYFDNTDIKNQVIETLCKLAKEVQIIETTKMGRKKPITETKMVIKY